MGNVVYIDGEEYYEMDDNELREMNQVNLETFTFNMKNMFEQSANMAIKKLIQDGIHSDRKKKKHLKTQKKIHKDYLIFTNLMKQI